jgi:hypothetical protein
MIQAATVQNAVKSFAGNTGSKFQYFTLVNDKYSTWIGATDKALQVILILFRVVSK